MQKIKNSNIINISMNDTGVCCRREVFFVELPSLMLIFFVFVSLCMNKVFQHLLRFLKTFIVPSFILFTKDLSYKFIVSIILSCWCRKVTRMLLLLFLSCGICGKNIIKPIHSKHTEIMWKILQQKHIHFTSAQSLNTLLMRVWTAITKEEYQSCILYIHEVATACL